MFWHGEWQAVTTGTGADKRAGGSRFRVPVGGGIAAPPQQEDAALPSRRAPVCSQGARIGGGGGGLRSTRCSVMADRHSCQTQLPDTDMTPFIAKPAMWH